ncbi:hypothetical protein B0J14DRAFT_344991 [Halenospora varia]|nr:hypothetical protein B0J14DRAFT_344991 [Halenospora varia]
MVGLKSSCGGPAMQCRRAWRTKLRAAERKNNFPGCVSLRRPLRPRRTRLPPGSLRPPSNIRSTSYSLHPTPDTLHPSLGTTAASTPRTSLLPPPTPHFSGEHAIREQPSRERRPSAWDGKQQQHHAAGIISIPRCIHPPASTNSPGDQLARQHPYPPSCSLSTLFLRPDEENGLSLDSFGARDGFLRTHSLGPEIFGHCHYFVCESLATINTGVPTPMYRTRPVSVAAVGARRSYAVLTLRDEPLPNRHKQHM